MQLERDHSMNHKMNITLIAIALAAAGATAGAQTLVWSDTDFTISPTDWSTYGWPGILQSVNGQLIVTEDFFGCAQTNNPAATHVPAVHALPPSGALLDQQTLELRCDLVSVSQNDAFAAIALNWGAAPDLGSGYMFFKDEDEVGLMKFYNRATSFAWFFFSNQPITNRNVTLVLALTRRGSNVVFNTQVLDKANANAILFDCSVTDTPDADPVLPNRAVRGFLSSSDPVGTPWPLLESPAVVELTLTWFNSQLAPDPHAEVIYDNLELWQFESPQLTIENAVVLSWPLTQGQFILESAPALNGPWDPVPDPWLRTIWDVNNWRNEVCVRAPECARFFRLRQAP